MYKGTSMLLTVNEHTMQLERAINECRREYNILIDELTKRNSTTTHNNVAQIKTDEGKSS